MDRTKVIFSMLAAFLMLFHLGVASTQGQIEIDTTMSAPFSLVDHDGQPTTDQNFRGRFMLVFFGYTSCPDVCPMHLQTISHAMDLLGEAGDRVQPIFITIDPERDTENLKKYVQHFHPEMVGLSGTSRQIAAAAQAYGTYYVKVIDANKNNPLSYLINHTAYIYLIGPDGKFRAAFDHDTAVEVLVMNILQNLAQN